MSKRAELDRQMREALRELELMSHVPASGYQPTGRSPSSDEHPGGRRPPGDYGHTHYAQDYGPPFHPRTTTHPGCIRDDQRERVLRRAQAEVDHMKGRTERPAPIEETPAERAARIVAEGEGFELTEVAVRFRCGEREIRKAREAAGREIMYGRVLVEQGGLTTEERRRRARELRDPPNNLPQNSIARMLGVDKATISRDLRGG